MEEDMESCEIQFTLISNSVYINFSLTPLTTLFSCFLSFFSFSPSVCLFCLFPTSSWSSPVLSYWPLFQTTKSWQTSSSTLAFSSEVITNSRWQVNLLNSKDGMCLLQRKWGQPSQRDASFSCSQTQRCIQCSEEITDSIFVSWGSWQHQVLQVLGFSHLCLTSGYPVSNTVPGHNERVWCCLLGPTHNPWKSCLSFPTTSSLWSSYLISSQWS